MREVTIYWSVDRRHVASAAATTLVSLLLTTVLIAVLRGRFGLTNASAVYLLAVMVVAVGFGRVAAVIAAVGAFLLYNYLFVAPTFTLLVADPDQLVNLVLLLVMGIVSGHLAGLQRSRAESAELREREALVLFQVSRALATRMETGVALSSIVETLQRATTMSRVRLILGSDTATERVTSDTDPGAPFPRSATYSVLRRTPGDQPSRWTRVHDPAARSRPAGTAGTEATPETEAYRVNIDAGEHALGALWALRLRSSHSPSSEETRMLAAAADQIGQAVEQDRLRKEANSAELARQSDALKTALLDSVSHDLRTPLASIRAAAGSLMDPDLPWSPGERQQSAQTIDLEAERLNRLVTNLLDMSRIEAGGLRAESEPYPLDELIRTTLHRIRPPADRPVEVQMHPELPLVFVDPTFMDQILTNAIENALKYAPAGAAIRLAAASLPNEPYVRMVIEDGGQGVPDEALGHLFEKFYRVRRRGEGARRGTGVGLAVVQGLVETMGGRIRARRSELGGLAIDVDLPLAAAPPSTVTRDTKADAVR
jgi:two-component system sensor histidine kinase KdpD